MGLVVACVRVQSGFSLGPGNAGARRMFRSEASCGLRFRPSSIGTSSPRIPRRSCWRAQRLDPSGARTFGFGCSTSSPPDNLSRDRSTDVLEEHAALALPDAQYEFTILAR